MKILQINTEKTWRGGERQTLLTMKGLSQAGIDVSLLSLKAYPLAQKALDDAFHVVEADNQKQAFRYLLKYGRRFDLLHAQASRGQGLAVMTRLFHQRPVLYTRRVDFCPRGWPAKLKYRFTSQVVAISKAIKDIVQPVIPGRNIEVIPSCIDTSRQILSASSRAMEFRKKFHERKIIATIAAFVPHKDPLTMVRAVHHLKEMSRADSFVFAHFGQGELHKDVVREVNRLGLENDYLFMGFENQVESFYPIFDVFVMSSQEEGLGSSVLEAFRYRVPVVSTDAGGLKDLVSGRGIVCPACNPLCLARGMLQVMDLPQSAIKLASKAYAYVVERHSLERMTRDYVRLYEMMLGSRQGNIG